MPEGDTIHRSARHLQLALAGREIVRCSAYRPELLQPTRIGRTVTAVEARGKNLLIHFDDRRALYSHMKMTGSWHVYRPGERWQRPEHLGRVVLANGDYVAVCFQAPDIKLLTEPGIERHPVLSSMGPDLLGNGFGLEEAVRRLRQRNEVPLGVAVLDQTAVAGIGNVYKSEMLFLLGLDPFGLVGVVPDDRLRRLLRETRAMMKRNLTTPVRTTRTAPGPDLWVYERAGERCLRCRERIELCRQGEQRRTTFFCPKCQ